MSRETSEWLNQNTLIGNTDIRGTAWHYRVNHQGSEPNHYPREIPVADVLRRLFNFEVVEAPLFYQPNGEFVPIMDRKAMIRDDTHEILGVFKSGYQGHQYHEWLLENVATILDDELGISSAGLLRNGAQAWVEVSVPETFKTPEGVEFMANLLATTSFDGSLATTYKRSRQDTVCDNTRDMALAGEGEVFKARHSKYSGFKIMGAREALALVHTMEEDFAAEIAELCATKVSDAQWNALLTQLVPINDELSKAGITKAENKRAELNQLYKNDNRVAPWTGTAFGVSAAFNTWRQHMATVRKGTPRVIRNMENYVTGKTTAEDRNVLEVLAGIQG